MFFMISKYTRKQSDPSKEIQTNQRTKKNSLFLIHKYKQIGNANRTGKKGKDPNNLLLLLHVCEKGKRKK
jgi:hypothetical protein